MLKVANLSLAPGQAESLLTKKAAKEVGAPVSDLHILRKSVDARKKQDIRLIYTVSCTCRDEAAVLARCRSKKVSAYDPVPYEFPVKAPVFAQPPVVVGAGPAGLFCALLLARAGAKPILLERGRDVDRRTDDVARFWQTGQLDLRSNVQFGEGGAGTFSDGKLNTGTNDPRHPFILRQFVKFGAPESICFDANPHVGTDILRDVVRTLREEIKTLGGQVRFENQVIALHRDSDRISGVTVQTPAGTERLDTGHVCLAIGHSARDTFQMLYDSGVALEPKAFAMGVRIEHSQAAVTRAQYGSDGADLPVPGYKLACHLDNGRAAFSFCVCPGGVVVAAASEDGGVVTNGMSYHARDGENINGALLVNITPADFPSDHPLAGVDLQRQLEQAAFRLGGGDYRAPCQTVGDFLANRPSASFGTVRPSYRPGVTMTDLRQCLPDFMTDTMAQAIPLLARKLRGYDDPDALLTAVESRSSSPVRIVRDETYQSPLRGLYPCGEGAGYAGGILSAAADGIRCAEQMCLHG
jgi:uncharacterized FAD-dependent dehydrogenase